MRKERGITLLALVVTIIILIILATVSINIVVEDGGVFTKAEQAKYAYEMSEVQQRFDMAILEVKTKNKGQAPVDKYIEHLKEKGIIEPDSIVENPDGSIEVTTPDGWVAQIEKEEDGEYVKRVVVEGKADNLPVRITNVQLTPTTHDITVKLTVLRGEKAKYSYYYKQGAITDEEKSLSGEELIKNHSWKKAADKTDKLEITIGDDIEQAQQYTVMVEAIEGNVVQSRGYATARTTEVPIATGAITFGELSWENGLAKVEVKKNTQDYHLQYQVVQKDEMPANDKWNTVEDKTKNEVEVGELDLGQVVVARLWDGYKGGASISSFEVKDEEKPDVNITKTEPTSNSIVVTLVATDAESGMPKAPDKVEYKYYHKKSTEGSYPEEPTYTGEDAKHEITGLEQETEYDIKVEVSDRAKNKGEHEVTKIKTIKIPDGGDGKTGAITFEDLGWENKKVSVNITKTDTNYQLQYQIVKKDGKLSTAWTTEPDKTTNTKNIADLSLGDQVVARLWDGRQGGNTATFTVKDEKVPNAATINLNNVTNIETGETINVTVTQSDSESGIDISKCKWILHTQKENLGTEDSIYTTSSFVHGTFSTETQTLTNAISTEGTYYLHVLSVDNAGNRKETVSGAITVKTPTVAESKGVTQSTTTTIPDSLGNNVVVPGGFKIANDSGKNVEEGIVIEDDSGNQFVWIPVSNIDGDNNESNGITGTPIKTSKGDKEITLGRYTFATTSPGTPTLVQRGSEHANRNKEYKIPEYEYQEITTNERTNGGQGAKNLAEFVKSVQDNHGYYLARYEAGKGTDGKPVSKAGAVWNNITQPEASAEAQKMYEEKDYTSDLVNSYTWDTAIVYIQAMGNDNYANTTNPKSSNMNTGETGNEKCHIFDMAGNVAEWTTEYSTGASLGGNCPCVFRGGYYDYYLKKVYPAYRWRITLYENVDCVGFRPILYLK